MVAAVLAPRPRIVVRRHGLELAITYSVCATMPTHVNFATIVGT